MIEASINTEEIKETNKTEIKETPTTKKTLVTPTTISIYKNQIEDILGINKQEGTINKTEGNMGRRKGLTIKNIGRESGKGRGELSDGKVTGNISDNINGPTIIECSDGSFVKIDQKRNGYENSITYKVLTQTEKNQFIAKTIFIAEQEDKEDADELLSNLD